METVPVIDLFAGPGGLGEGFSSLTRDGEHPFHTVMSIERDAVAHQTLRLRAFYRKILDEQGNAPQEYLDFLEDESESSWQKMLDSFPDAWKRASEEAVCDELSDENDERLIADARERLRNYVERPIIIGGPPCQAYSLVGRARRTGDPKLATDEKQTLYTCYLDFIEGLKPSVFVMENVKGMLSAKLQEGGVFSLISRDVDELGYRLHSLVVDNPSTPSDYVVRAEKYGVPQARHRVILLGVDKSFDTKPSVLMPNSVQKTVASALCGMPAVRSGFSRRACRTDDEWDEYVRGAAERIAALIDDAKVQARLRSVAKAARLPRVTEARQVTSAKGADDAWYRSGLSGSRVLTHHETRRHIAEDLERYLFSSSFSQVYGRSPKLREFPEELLPQHRNVQQHSHALGSVVFADRFKTQIAGKPATTVTAHISKDGHYYIHPDPKQCRSLTPREAARLQTFPDSYHFMGNRTHIYQQIGNAVPPLLARQIADIVASLLQAS